MKKNKKGFTLIELLAVIVILAIVALIAVPIVLNLIEKSRKGSAQDSAYGLRKATQLYYSSGLISSPTGIEEIEFNCDGENCISDKRDTNGEYIKLEIDGTVPTSGKITVNPTGELNFENIIFYNKYECIIEQSGPITCDGIKVKYITIKTDINSWAQNKTVTIDYDSSCTDKQYCIDGTTWLDYTGEIEISSNTEVKAKATCAGANIEESHIEEKIDTTAPVLNAENPFSVAKLSPTSLQIVVNEVEEDGEIYGYAYSTDGGLSYSEIQKSNVYIVNNLTPGETYKIKVKVYNDTYGKENTDESKAVVESEEKEVTLDTIAIELKVDPEGEVWASEKTVTIEGYPEGYDVKYSDDGGTTWDVYTGGIKVTENGKTIIGCVFSGDTAVSNKPSVTVNYIDNEVPVITGVTYTKADGSVYTSEEWTNGNVTVTVEGNDGDGSGIKEYQITYDNGSTWSAVSHPIIIDKTSIIQIKVIDGVNKESNVTDSITINIDKVAPILTVDEEQIVATEDTITIPYTVDDAEATVTCEYGLDETYGSIGTIENGTCTISELNDGTEYFFKLTATDQVNNNSEPVIGTKTTLTSRRLENRTYASGDAVTLGGYNWHVMGDDGTYVTLIMDVDQLGSNSSMVLCTNDSDATTDCGIGSSSFRYSWDKSKVREYFLETLEPELLEKIENMVRTEICVNPSNMGSNKYGGYLMSEVNAISGASCTSTVSDYIRLISYSENWNLSPSYSGTSASYPNVSGITRLTSKEGIYSSSGWWTMGAAYGSTVTYYRYAYYVGQTPPTADDTFASYSKKIRPVITIVKE